MAAKKPDIENFEETLTVKVAEKDEGYKGPRVRIFIPELEDSGDGGLKVDQYEHVTIANEEKMNVDYVRRGVHNDVSVPTFIALKERYPNL